jgi:hypothetical protein
MVASAYKMICPALLFILFSVHKNLSQEVVNQTDTCNETTHSDSKHVISSSAFYSAYGRFFSMLPHATDRTISFRLCIFPLIKK